MFQFVKSMLSDVDNQGSSKRVLMLWIGVVVWSFVNVMVFLGIKPFPADTANTLILYDVVLIGSLAGLALSEKIWGRASVGQTAVPDAPPKTEASDKPREDKTEAVK